MFTGLIQDVGEVREVVPRGGAVAIAVRTRLVSELAIGDSLAVNGVCLTVTTTRGDVAVATAIPETLDRTTLGALAAGSRVNLEPALRLGDRLGGHIVQGHVDGVGTVAARQERGLSVELTVAAPPGVMRYVVHKGSITIDGASLTVARRDGPERLTVALVPHTLGATTLQDLAPGARVNLEADILAKYLEQLTKQSTEPGGAAARDSGGITEAWLRDKGFG